MPVDTLDPAFFEQHVARAKAAWRRRARALTWEEKIAAIERMRGRDTALRAVQEENARARERKTGDLACPDFSERLSRDARSGDEFEPLFDSVEPLLVVIEPLIGRRNVPVEQRKIAAQARNVLFERADALGKSVEFDRYRVLARTQSTQMLKNQVFDIFDHISGPAEHSS